MQLEIITPEAKIFSGEVEAVQLPGLDGLFQVLDGHTAVISTLQKGRVKVDLTSPFNTEDKYSKLIHLDSNTKVIHVDINGGVIELQNNKMIVLAE
ncbi:MAG: hypothetical protein V4638_01875 [Bacteroidota bacterium]